MMNKQELNEAFSRLHASGDLMEEVLSLEKEKRKSPNGRKMIRRVAACAAVLAILLTALLGPSEENYITGPGVLVVRAYEPDEPSLSVENSVILKEGIVVPMEYTKDPTINLLSKALGLPFLFSVPMEEYADKNITFEIRLSGGDFENLGYLSNYFDYPDSYAVLRARYLGQQFTIPNNYTIYWNRTGHIFDDQKREIRYVELDTKQVFVDIIVRADKYIVGYAVIEIFDVSAGNRFVYNTRMIKSVSFPQVDGRFQRISEKYVKKQIQLVHDRA